MSSNICEGIQTCFEPLQVQPRVLGLALFSYPRPSFPTPSQIRGGAVGPDTCQGGRVFVHPLITRSASALSEKSLEMCTESLGSETGSGDYLGEEDEAETFLMCPSLGREFRESKSKKGNQREFPPPLKSMTGSSVVQIQPSRGDGRLVLQAVGVSSCHNSFLVERGQGRLRLSLIREEDTTEDNGEGQEEEEEEEEKVGCGRRPSRCKEGKGLMIWKPRWVAT